MSRLSHRSASISLILALIISTWTTVVDRSETSTGYENETAVIAIVPFAKGPGTVRYNDFKAKGEITSTPRISSEIRPLCNRIELAGLNICRAHLIVY
ncbi:hypothetical protein A0H81_07990 [Grifola frondosa]|uniref:Uncharacterized protein n=1 Tax=Grifola frondosa TaxID=5627 RepID=A0A1C7M6L3_GRIFR|nr:hypothetical protein A0H81_07990 [Grifola frondosa]